jgi:hypothetical protein
MRAIVKRGQNMGSDTQLRIRKNLKFGFLSIFLQCSTLFLPIGNPDTTGTNLQVDYAPFGKADSWGRPFANAMVGLQYTMYDKHSGASSNSNVAGRSVSDNNTLFLWMAI